MSKEMLFNWDRRKDFMRIPCHINGKNATVANLTNEEILSFLTKIYKQEGGWESWIKVGFFFLADQRGLKYKIRLDDKILYNNSVIKI